MELTHRRKHLKSAIGFCCVCVILLLMVSEQSCGLDEDSLDAQWEQWKIYFEKQYKDQVEEEYRRNIWEKNMRMIEVHNQEAEEGKHTFTMGMNEFSDLADDEWLC